MKLHVQALGLTLKAESRSLGIPTYLLASAGE